MFSLILERNKYQRIRSGMTAEDVIKVYSCPVGSVFSGQIVPVNPPIRFVYAKAGDSYAAIARREGVDEAKLRELNDGKNIYPTLRIWLP